MRGAESSVFSKTFPWAKPIMVKTKIGSVLQTPKGISLYYFRYYIIY
jgi:hypothetical protein